jgi:hypothetical protein
LVSSVVTNAFPEDPLMKVLLPALLAVPVILTFIFETPLLEFLRSFTEPDKEGNVGLAGQFILAFRRHTLRITDRLVGAVGQEEAKSGMRAVWEEHSKELGASALVRARSSQSSFTTLSTSEPSARHADGPAAGPSERLAPNDGGAAISQQSPDDGGAAPRVRAQVLQVRGNLHTLVHVADQANQEATAAFAAAMTVAGEGKKTPVPDDHSILGNKTSAPWTFLSNRTAVAAAAAKVADKAPVDKAAKAAKADKAVMSHLLQLDPTALETELRSLGETKQVSEAPACNEGGNQVSEAPGSWRATVAPGGPPWELVDSGDSLVGLAELRAVLRLFTRELEAVKHADHDYERMQRMLIIFLRLVQTRSASERLELAPLLQALHKVQQIQAIVHKALLRMQHRMVPAAFEQWRDTYLAAKPKRALAGMAARESDARDGVGGGANGSSESISTPELHSTIQSESISTPELHSTAPPSVMTWVANLGSDRGRRGSKEPSEAHLDA